MAASKGKMVAHPVTPAVGAWVLVQVVPATEAPVNPSNVGAVLALATAGLVETTYLTYVRPGLRAWWRARGGVPRRQTAGVPPGCRLP
mgnify:CR=1 FL=1